MTTGAPHSRSGEPRHMHKPGLQRPPGLLASLPHSLYSSSTSSCLPSCGLPFKKMSLISGDMK